MTDLTLKIVIIKINFCTRQIWSQKYFYTDCVYYFFLFKINKLTDKKIINLLCMMMDEMMLSIHILFILILLPKVKFFFIYYKSRNFAME